MNPLKLFYEDVNTRESVKVFFTEQLKQMAVDRVFSKKDVTGLHEAQSAITEVFNALEELYKEKKPITPLSSPH